MLLRRCDSLRGPYQNQRNEPGNLGTRRSSWRLWWIYGNGNISWDISPRSNLQHISVYNIYISVCIFMYMYSYQFISWMFHKNKLGPWLFHRKKIRFQSPMTTWKDPGNLLLPSGNLLWLQKSSFMCVWLCMYNIWVCYSIDLYRYMLYSGKFLGKHPQIRDFCQLKLPEFPPVHRALSPHLPSGVLRKTSRAAEGRRRDGQNERAK